MFLLFKVALQNKKHFFLLMSSFLSAILLTTANALEVSALGILINVDTLERLMSGASLLNSKAISLLGSHSETNPLQWIVIQVHKHLTHFSSLHILIGVLISVAILKGLALFGSRYMNQLLSIRMSRDLRYQYFRHIQLLPMNFYQKYDIGSLSSRVVHDSGQIAGSMNSILTNYLQAPFTICFSLIFCFYLSWQLSLIIFFGLPLIVIPIVVLTKRVKKAARQLQIKQEKFASILIDFLAGIQTVKIFAMEGFSSKRYKDQNDQIAVLESKTAKYGLLIRPILHMITTACLASSLLFGLMALHLTISELIVFCGFLQMSYETIKKFSDENTNIQRGVVAASRMFEVLNIKPEIIDHSNAVQLKEFHQSIQFDHIWFRYQTEWVLKDITFTIRKGETIAIVGPTGSGKSTLAQLIPRLYEVQKGEIRLDGKPLNQYTQLSLREQIAFVSQKPFLFNDTIRANIAFGRNFSQAEIQEAAKQAHAEDFIIQQPQQYESLLLEAGQNLSGGQQQRLAIARALVKKAPILVLDEATSSLDAIHENRIHLTTSVLKGKMTQIIIAHRLSTIQHADRIIFLDKGRKIAEGTKEELLKTCEPFKQMWDILHQEQQRPETALS